MTKVLCTTIGKVISIFRKRRLLMFWVIFSRDCCWGWNCCLFVEFCFRLLVCQKPRGWSIISGRRIFYYFCCLYFNRGIWIPLCSNRCWNCWCLALCPYTHIHRGFFIFGRVRKRSVYFSTGWGEIIGDQPERWARALLNYCCDPFFFWTPVVLG